MSGNYVYLSILLMASVTYLIRALPLVVFRRKIKNVFFRSALTYAPYITLSVLTFPSVFYCTGDYRTALGGTAVALTLTVCRKKLLFAVFVSCLTVYLLQLIF